MVGFAASIHATGHQGLRRGLGGIRKKDDRCDLFPRVQSPAPTFGRFHESIVEDLGVPSVRLKVGKHHLVIFRGYIIGPIEM